MQKSKSALVGCLAVLMIPLWAHAQEVINDEVKVIPYSQRDPRLPHPAHSNARVTLKAMVRNATCNTYRVWWDANRDGNYDNDPSRNVSRNAAANAVIDIGRNFLVPDVAGDTSLNINVRVRNNCNNSSDMRPIACSYTTSTRRQTRAIGRTSSSRSDPNGYSGRSLAYAPNDEWHQ